MKDFLKILAPIFFALFAVTQQAAAQETIYSNGFSNAESVSGWTLSGVTWQNNVTYGPSLQFATANSYAMSPAILPAGGTNLSITISARYGNYIYLQTSLDGTTWTPAVNGTGNLFSGSASVANATKSMPDGTRYLRFTAMSGTANDVFLISAMITGAACDNPSLPVTGISLNKTSTVLSLGKTEQLTAIVAPLCALNKTVVWSSSNNNVATVNSSGLVTAGSSGTATITATTQDGGFKAQCQVMASEVIYVNDFATVESVNDWTLSGIAWDSGNSGQLVLASGSYAVMPALPQNYHNLVINVSTSYGRYIDLSTSTDGVAYASQGLFAGNSGLTVGTKEIPDGTRYVKFTASSSGCYLASVSVTGVACGENEPVTGISLNKTSTKLYQGITEQLTADVLPFCAANKNVTWSSSNTAVATVNANGLTAAIAPGETVITAKTSDGNITAQCATTVTAFSNSFETDDDIAGWTLVNAYRYSTSFYASDGSYSISIASGGSITTPELNLSGFNKPIFSVAMYNNELIDVYTSTDGVNFNKIGADALFLIAKTVKYIRLVNPGTSSVYADMFSIQEAPAPISSFPYINSFETADDIAGWRLVNASRYNFTYMDGDYVMLIGGSGGSITTPELNLSSLEKPFFSIAIYQYNSPIDVYTSTDGINFNKIGSSASCFIDKTVKYIRLTNSGTFSIEVDMFRIAEAPLYINDFAASSSVDDWTLNGAAWYDYNNGSLYFSSVSSYAVMPTLPDGFTDLVITASTSSGNLNLYTSPDGVNYDNQGALTAGTATKNMPDGTRFVKFVGNDYLTSVIVTGNACKESLPVTGVSLSKTSINLTQGATESLIAILTPVCVQNRNVVWSSSNNNVATVNSSGLVTAGSQGTATITATTVDGGFKAQCEVTVNDIIYANDFPNAASVSDWTLSDASWNSYNSGELAFPYNGSYAIMPVLPQCNGDLLISISAIYGNCIYLQTSTDGVSYANQGLFTGTSSGSVETATKTIPAGARYVKFVNLNQNNYAYIVSLTITGSTCKESLPVTGVSLNKTITTLQINATDNLRATITPSCAQNESVTWSSSNPAVATVNPDGLVSAISTGRATITATTADGGFKAKCLVIVGKVIYSNDFATADKANECMLGGATWRSDYGGSIFLPSNSSMILPVLPDAANLMITVTAYYGNYCNLQTSPDGVNYADQGTIASDYSLQTTMIHLPDGTRYVKFGSTYYFGSNVASVTITGEDVCTTDPVAGIYVNKTSTTLLTNTTERLFTAVEPVCAASKNVTWSSSNGMVAIVNSDGLVSAVFPGTAIITATTADGKFSAQCSVTVNLSGQVSNNLVSTNLGQWYSERESDNYMQFVSGSSEYFFSGGQVYPYYTFDGSAFPCNINNDNTTDFYMYNSGTGSLNNYRVRIVGENGEIKTIPLPFPSSTSDISPCDYNGDGLTDFKIGSNIFVQGANSSFTQKALNIMNRDTWLNTSGFSMSSLAGHTGAWIESAPVAYVPPQTANLINMDLDGNGLPDLLDTKSGEVLLNMGADVFVKEQLGGYVMFRDLTGNGKMDNVVFNQSTKTVVANIVQDDGSWKSQTLISNLAMDNQIWACDYDRDGDADIILPFSYSASNAGSFIAVMVNDGKGNFTMKENFYTEQLYFVGCADLDNDGYYDILAANGWSSSLKAPSGTVYWLKGNAQYQFALQPQPLYSTSVSGISVADINNDGKYELLCSDGMHPINISAAECKSPAQPAKPEFAYEPSTGYLKVSWQPSSDPRYSPVDLTYEVRVGSAPGKGDIVYANAYSDGRRRNLLDGNANYALEKLLDASAWNAGNYYISVQAINPVRRASAFSQEAVFTKTLLSAKFVLSEEQTTSDTITVMCINPHDARLEYIWNFDGGTVIDKNADETVIKLKFTAPGQKRITLQTKNAAGELSALCAQETYLFANKFTNGGIPYSPSATPIAFADLDNCGKLEALTNNGVYQNDGKGNFTKVNKIFNTNLNLYNGVNLFDYNSDGMADIFNLYGNWSVYKNTSAVGDITFPISPETLNHYHSLNWDFNNDGKIDALELGDYSNCNLYLNNGDYKNFTQIKENFNNYFTVIDLDKDGFLDIIELDTYNKYAAMLFNDGKGSFTEKDIPLSYPSNSYYFLFADVNSDGYVDFLASAGQQLYVYLNNQNESFANPAIIDIPVVFTGGSYSYIKPEYAYDFDNNGYPDIFIDGYDSDTGILYFYENLQTKFYKNGAYDYYGTMLSNPVIADIDGDGVQDFQSGNYLYKNNTTVTNTPPAPPANIRYAQLDETLLIEWDAAKDAESPASMLRYNVSVKKQGATGDNVYVISPLNSAANDVMPVSLQGYPYNPYYRAATRMEIPLTGFDIGATYEIRIQTLDGWNAVSAFSAPVAVKIENNPQIKLPASICAGMSATVEYRGTGTPQQRVWNWGGGTLLSESGNQYEVVWNSEGAKTISVTVSGVTNEAMLQVLPTIDPALPIPGVASAQTQMRIPLPNAQFGYVMEESYYDANGFVYGYQSGGGSGITVIAPRPAPVWQVNSVTGAAALTFPQAGYYTMRITVNTPCGAESNWYQVQAIDIPRPAIQIVTSEDSKSRIAWEVPANLPSFVNGVNVYREGSKYNDFILEASLPLSQTSYVDPYSNVNIMSSRYRITWTTNLGAESQPSVPHQGIHLMINQGIGNGWNLFWGQYEGAIIESFRILRGTTPDNLSLLAEVAGSAASYSDFTAPAGGLYYAVEYNTVYTPEFSSMLRKVSASDAGRSNVVGTADAFNVKLATGLSIDSPDEITPSQPSIFLVANITPFTATYQAANWNITGGSNLATINGMGMLTLTGAGNGSVTVQATTIDGSNLTAQKTIQVRNVITSIKIRADRDVLTQDFYYTYLYADILPAEMASSDIEWSVSGKSGNFDVMLYGNYLYVSNILSDGTVTVRATATNGSGMYAEGTLSVSSLTPIIAVKAPDVNPQAYPNPFTGTIHVSGAEGCMLQVLNLAGVMVHNQKITNSEETLQLGRLPAGIYIFRFEKDGQSKAVKMMKAK